MIQITCKGNSAICTRTERLTSGMVGLQCEFIFDEAWDGLAKTAVFMAGNEQRDVLLTGAVCTVPWEVLKTAGYQLVIGVYGTNAGGTLVIPTVYAMCGGIASGADPSGDESTDPTLPVWGQMQGQIGNLADLATASKDNLVAAINEAAQSGGGGGGTPVTEQTVSDWGFTKNTGTYSKPSGGIPKTDLADDVQASLSKANSALQEHQDVSGKQDTLIQSGAAVGQIAKITAVDSNGKPTAWQAVDMPSGENASTENWKLIRKITVPDDPTTDASGVTWIVDDTGAVTGIEFDTDENGSAFNCSELSITGEGVCAANGRLDYYAGDTLLCSYNGQQVDKFRYSWAWLRRLGAVWQAVGGIYASWRFIHDTQALYASGFFMGPETALNSVAVLSLRGTKAYNAGYAFEIWGR